MRIDLLGRPGWRSAAGSGWLEGKFAPLVACVAVEGRQPRDALARLFVPGDPARAGDNLRQHVRRLRLATGHEVFAAGEALSLAPGIDCDCVSAPPIGRRTLCSNAATSSPGPSSRSSRR